MSLPDLELLKEEMKKCFRCSLCKMVPLPTVRNSKYTDCCPANQEFHFHGYSGSGKSIMALSLLDGRIETDSTLAEITYACTSCGLCDVACKFIMEAERHRINMALREHIVDEGFGLKAHQDIIGNIKKYGMPGEINSDLPGKWPGSLEQELSIMAGEKAEVLIFGGGNGDAGSASVNIKLAGLLLKAGIKAVILGNSEPDSGLYAYWTGYRNIFTEMAADLTSIINKLEIKTVVAVSGADFGMLRSKYPDYGARLDMEVLHAAEILEMLIKNGALKLKKPLSYKVTYHDPCYLGRQSEPPIEWQGEDKITHGCMTYSSPPRPINRGVNGVFSSPRKILQSISGLSFTEMHRVREYSFCCGGGGGVPESFPGLAMNTAQKRIDEARDTGAEYIVTACHHCRENLSRAQKDNARGVMPVVDIIDLVYEASGIDGEDN